MLQAVDGAKEVTSIISQISAASEELLSQSQLMKELVGKFRLKVQQGDGR